MNQPIYLDYNATTPIDPEVAAAMRPYLDQYFGNPSSSHRFGIETKKAVEKARRQIAGLLNCNPEEIVFTSGGSESNNWAIKGVAYQNKDRGNHIITSAIEHPAVSEVCSFLESQGFKITTVPVDEFGMVDPVDVEKAVSPATILITIMHANNEVGTLQPIVEISEIAKSQNIIFHSDGAQSVGKVETDVQKLGVDLFSVAGHKLYAPKGIGALYIKKGVKLQKLIHGADHERNYRAGTENVLEIVGLGKAAEIAKRDIEKNIRHAQHTRDRLFNALRKELPEIKLNGHSEKRLSNTLSVSFPKIEANTMLAELEEVAASAGAACHADNVDVSVVLTAMKLPIDFAMGTIRFSTGRHTTEQEIDLASENIIKVVKKLRPSTGEILEPVETPGEIKLTKYTHGLGCACKIRPQYLEKVLQDLPVVFDKNVLIGAANADDAAVYKINDETAIVQTLDFFTPVVDDPYYFGSIAAANALSDIYAMGAKPLFALNIVGFPDNRLPMQVLKDILRGASDKAAEAGISVLGGHTVEDTEPKFGMVVTGAVHPAKVLSNEKAKPGDVLILTKPIGTGIISTAVKNGMADQKTADKARDVMAMLNAAAAEVIREFNISTCTDVTGFGLIGHLKEIVEASGLGAEIYSNQVPLIENVYELALAGAIPGGTKNNLDFVSKITTWSDDVSELMKLIICDAQTSGGLLIAVPEQKHADLLKALKNSGIEEAEVVGKITEGNGILVK